MKDLNKYWSILLALLSGSFFTGSWMQARATATSQAVQGAQIQAATDALHDIIRIESDHTIDIATVKQQIADMQARVDSANDKGKK